MNSDEKLYIRADAKNRAGQWRDGRKWPCRVPFCVMNVCLSSEPGSETPEWQLPRDGLQSKSDYPGEGLEKISGNSIPKMSLHFAFS